MQAEAPPGLDALGRFASRRELEALRRRVLRPGERVLDAVDGTLDGRPGLLAATDGRVLFVARRLLGRAVREWSLDTLEGVGVDAGRDDAVLTLTVAGGPVAVHGVRKAGAASFAAAVRPFVADREFRIARWVGDPRNVDPPEGNGLHERLRRLERMRVRRSITEKEYTVNRRRILEEAGLPIDLRLRERMGSR